MDVSDEPIPFTIEISKNVLDDLKERLGKARFPGQLEDIDWEDGTELSTLKEYVQYWKTEFDWRAQETRLNAFKHFKLRCNDLSIHFIHERSANPNAIPLILSHGWPDSFFGFYKIIKKLVTPEDENMQAFHVVVPSLPGFGFSEAPKRRGFGIQEIAKTFNQLMIKLGYTKYVAHGGDWGSSVTRSLAIDYPQHCAAIQLTFPASPPPTWRNPIEFLKLVAWQLLPRNWVYGQAAEDRIDRFKDFQKNGMGFFRLQATKPQSLAYGLNDSPMGLLAWIMEKFHDLADDFEHKVTKDELLTTVMIYWTTETIASSIRLYKEFDQNPLKSLPYIKQPTGFSVFPIEIYLVPRSWLKLHFNIQHWVEHSSGGHFPAIEVSEDLLNDIRQFFQSNVVKTAMEK